MDHPSARATRPRHATPWSMPKDADGGRAKDGAAVQVQRWIGPI
jgi:hypothetical protein